jgi:hypothetical protein
MVIQMQISMNEALFWATKMCEPDQLFSEVEGIRPPTPSHYYKRSPSSFTMQSAVQWVKVF